MGFNLKHRIIGAGLGGIAALGADRWLAPAARGAGVILTFHHVRPAPADAFSPNGLLEITPEHLDLTLRLVRGAGFDIVALDDVPARLAERRSRPFAVLTFDDGYRDNVEHAKPVLERHGAPWTLFVTTDYAAGQGRLWWIELEEVVRRRDRLAFGEGSSRRDMAAGTALEKSAAFAAAYAALRAGPEEELRATIGRWCDEAGIDREALVRRLCLGWDDLLALAGAPGLTIGAHTLTHPMLAKHDEDVARREIVEARGAIERRLGVPVRHLSYPVGDPTSAGPREFRLAREAGYATAVTTRPGHLFPEHAGLLTALPRVSVNGLHQSAGAVRALLSGVPFLLWNRGRRVNAG
ncbi:MAG: polysaccharide deacetylase [Enterovirga sp.]|nr:polysaccharide deacetylase [Enterovirga sp.]